MGNSFKILELESSISENIRKYKNFFDIWARRFCFQKFEEFFGGFGMGSAYKKDFLLRKYKESF